MVTTKSCDTEFKLLSFQTTSRYVQIWRIRYADGFQRSMLANSDEALDGPPSNILVWYHQDKRWICESDAGLMLWRTLPTKSREIESVLREDIGLGPAPHHRMTEDVRFVNGHGVDSYINMLVVYKLRFASPSRPRVGIDDGND